MINQPMGGGTERMEEMAEKRLHTDNPREERAEHGKTRRKKRRKGRRRLAPSNIRNVMA